MIRVWFYDLERYTIYYKNFYRSFYLLGSYFLICFLALDIQAEDKTPLNICEGNVFLGSQAEVDAFTYTRITGNLIIQGDDIVNLSSLDTLMRVEGTLFINDNPLLSTLKGLENLEFARKLVIFGNAQLQDISSIADLELSVDIDVLETGLNVSGNPQLSQCCVLEKIPTRGQKSIGQNAPGCNSLDEISLRCDSSNKILGFMLVNAETDEDIGLLEKGDILDFEELGDIPLSIRVLTEGDDIGVVSIGLKGPLNIFRFERLLPYTLLGDGVNGEYTGVLFPPGYYILTTTLYLDNTLSNTLAEPLTIFFSVSAPNPKIQSFSLINAVTNQKIQDIMEGTVIDLSKLGDTLVNIQANTEPTQIGSVDFALSGAIQHKQLENIFPYALFGNDPLQLTSFKGKNLIPGRYTLQATPFEKVFAQGQPGEVQEIHFEVIQGSTDSNAQLLIFPNPSEGAIKIRTLGEATALRLYNLQGEKIAEQFVNQENFWELHLAPGIYIIEKISDNQIIRKKIFIR